MTGRHTTQTAPQNPRAFRLPDIPEKHPDDMTSFKHLAENGNVGRLKTHLAHPETTIVSGERYICAVPGGPIRYPDLLVAFDADPELYEANNGYVVSFQGKPPELMLEIASRHSWRTDIDVEVKPGFYASLGVREYWRFDETGEFHGSPTGWRPSGRRPVPSHRGGGTARRRAAGIQRNPGAVLLLAAGTAGLVRPHRRRLHPQPGVRDISEPTPSASCASRRKKGYASWKQSCVSAG